MVHVDWPDSYWWKSFVMIKGKWRGFFSQVIENKCKWAYRTLLHIIQNVYVFVATITCVCVDRRVAGVQKWIGVNVRLHILSISAWWTIIIHYYWLSASYTFSLFLLPLLTLLSPSPTFSLFFNVLQHSAWSCHSVRPPSAYRFTDLCPTTDKCLHANFSAFSHTESPS